MLGESNMIKILALALALVVIFYSLSSSAKAEELIRVDSRKTQFACTTGEFQWVSADRGHYAVNPITGCKKYYVYGRCSMSLTDS
jgi:hypothetical protein